MNVTCPHCQLTGQLSDANIPPEGRYLDCPRCKGNFFVRKSAPASRADTVTDCPRCGYSNLSGERFDICPDCGMVARDYSAQRQQQGARPAQLDGERMRQDLERVQREKENKHRQHAAGEAAPLHDEHPVPETVVVPDAVRYFGWAVVMVGLLMLVWGSKGFYNYRHVIPADVVVTEYENTPGPLWLYLTNGLLPTLQILLGMYLAAAGSQFLQLRPWARKGVEAGAWSCIGCTIVGQLVKLIVWIRISSSSASFLYYLAGIADALLMTVIWSALPLAAVWYLRGDAIGKAFEE